MRIFTPSYAVGHDNPDPAQRRHVCSSGSIRRSTHPCFRTLANRGWLSAVAAHHVRVSSCEPDSHFLQHVRAVYVRSGDRTSAGKQAIPYVVPGCCPDCFSYSADRCLNEYSRCALPNHWCVRWSLRRASRVRATLPQAHRHADFSADTHAGVAVRYSLWAHRARQRRVRDTGRRCPLRAPRRDARCVRVAATMGAASAQVRWLPPLPAAAARFAIAKPVGDLKVAFESRLSWNL